MDVTSLYNANINNITIAKNAFDALATAFGQHMEAWKHEVTDRLSASHWTGPTSTVAQGRVADLGSELQAARQELSFVSKALASAAEQFALAQSHLISALDDAGTRSSTSPRTGGSRGTTSRPPRTSPAPAPRRPQSPSAAASPPHSTRRPMPTGRSVRG
ncbi:hypothetical protein [Kitasatospora sp. NPDC015120]|uniref:hypothetical protein n=1 Tax=Kitasatospora sp. NPDC015120 TaxID=3364023 RepID=UPI0036F46EE9